MSAFAQSDIEAARSEALRLLLAGAAGVAFEKRGEVHVALCPLHGEKTPSFKLTTEGPYAGRFKCFGCQESGDALDLLMKLRNQTWPELVRELAGGALTSRPAAYSPRPNPKPPERIPEAQLSALWEASIKLFDVPAWDDDGEWSSPPRVFLAQRGIDVGALAQLDVARTLPPRGRYVLPPWWPYPTDVHRLAVRMFDARGTFAGLQARAVTPVAKNNRQRNADGLDRYSTSKGLFFANAQGREVLRGTFAGSTVVVLEGMTDVLAACDIASGLEVPPAVLGVVSGSAAALAEVPRPAANVVVFTDADSAGNGYAAEVRKAWPCGPMTRARIVGEGKADFSDLLKVDRELARQHLSTKAAR